MRYVGGARRRARARQGVVRRCAVLVIAVTLMAALAVAGPGPFGPGVRPAGAVPANAVPAQWVAKQFTEVLGRAPAAGEWQAWIAYYQAQPSCTADNLTALPRYLTGVASAPSGPGLPTTVSTELAGLYPAATALDKATRAATLIRAAFHHDPNDNDWSSFIAPYVQGSATWATTVSRVYSFAMAFFGPSSICSTTNPGTGFGFSRPIDLRAKVMELLPATSPALTPSRTQAELASALQAAASGATVAQRTVTLRVGEVVRIGGAPNGNQQLVIPAGVTLTSEGIPAYAEPAAGTTKGLAYARMGRIVAHTSPGSPAVNPADGWICAGYLCNNIGMVALGSGAHLVGVWVDGQGIGDTNHKVANVQTQGSAAASATTPYDDNTTVIASRVSEPSRDGAAIRAHGSSVGTACADERIAGNLVTGYSSRHQFDRRGQAQWVDGISVHCEDAVVAHNSVVDVTDLGIVVSGSVTRGGVVTRQQSEVRHNTVLSAGLDAHVALGADAVGVCPSLEIPDANGVPRAGWLVSCVDVFAKRDFTGTSVHDNRFFTGPRTSFDVGLMVGGGAQWGDHQILNQGPDAAHVGAAGASFTNNTTGGVATQVNIGIDVHDMTHATVTGNPGTLTLLDGNPRVTGGKCPLTQRLSGASERASLTTNLTFTTGDASRGCVIGAPPVERIENVRINATGTGFEGSVTGSPFKVWGGDLPYSTDLNAMVDDFRDVRRMGANVIRLLLDTEDFVNAPACAGCPPTANAAAVDHLGDVAIAAEQVGLYLDITGLGITFDHNTGSWFDAIDATTAGETLRWQVQSTFWKAVATELRPRTSIAWYDLMNEPTMGVPATTWCFEPNLPLADPCWAQNIVKSLTDPADPSRQRTALEAAEDWMVVMRDAIKVGAGDTVHPVGVGNIFCGGALAQAAKNTLDFFLLHEYPSDSTIASDIANVNNCKQPGKPLVVEETYWTASGTNLDRFTNETQPAAAGYIGHFIGGTPSQLQTWIESNPSGTQTWWAHVIWLAWDQYFMRSLVRRNPTGWGVMPS